MTEMVELLAYPLIAVAGIITLMCWSDKFNFNKKYKFIALLLFLEFIFMTAYEQFVISTFAFSADSEIAPFYGYKLMLQAIFTAGYIHLHSRSQTIISITIMAALSLSVAMALSGTDVYYYEGVMLTLAACQLIAGFGGAIGGYCNSVSSIWGRAGLFWNKALSR